MFTYGAKVVYNRAMNTIKTALMSRTFWMIVAMFIIGGFQSIQSMIPAGSIVYVQGFLGMLAVYFKLNPSQNYGA